MKIWLISDLHFGVKNSNIEWMENINSYFNDFFIPFLTENKSENDILFILGDVFDNRQSINVLILNYVIEIFKKISRIIPIHILVGNHDIFYKNNTKINSLKILRQYAKIYSKPTTLNFQNKKFFIMPWIGNIPEEQTLINESNSDYIFCHTQISNTNFNKNIIIDSGIEIPDNVKIFSGHIHYRQQKNNLIYVGSPYSLTRSDIDNEKGIYSINLDNDKIEFFENTFSPRFLRKNINDIDLLTTDEFKDLIRNNYVDLIISSKVSEKFPYFIFNEIISGVSKNFNIEISDKNELVDINIDGQEDMDFNLLTSLLDYVNTNFEDEKIKNEIIKLYNKAIEII